MEVEFLILSRYAEVDRENNTLNIIGAGALGIQAVDFPTVQGAVFVATCLRFEAAECGPSLRMQIVVRNDHNETIHEAMDGKLEIAPPAPPLRYAFLRAAFVLARVIYPEPGYYRVVLLIDGEPVRETLFKVERIEKPQGEEERPANVGTAAT